MLFLIDVAVHNDDYTDADDDDDDSGNITNHLASPYCRCNIG